jgi:hypothetical protein
MDLPGILFLARLVLFVVIFISSMVAAISLGLAGLSLSANLIPELIPAVEDFSDGECPLTATGDGFGSKSPCGFSIFTFVAGLIGSFVNGMIFLVYACLRRSLPLPFLLVELLYSIIATIFFLAASIVVSKGFEDFCNEITPKNGSCSKTLSK